ncbi:DUF2782 domain-containing protein [Pseudomarimonas salicorniae]|uniref:DUF2782 domain-containing protein n=1 Tax=Pseudomarimonas salicorniae TaxID=2933270 RepID=A0ABT0GDP1_9GAMM|nr:DUF2782 domain-containing protein [Lysobacter sp. CAU 1642]MCK7592152.1 DUF2782 domain-containing protein [Lysobacter sp. CAU 1642]
MNRLSCLLLATLVGLAPLAALAQEPPPPREDAPLPEKLDTVPPPEDEPTVKIRAVDNGDTVEEYRVNGRLTMVKVRPRGGVPYTLVDTNGDGRLDRKDTEGPVAPVYWTLYEWD